MTSTIATMWLSVEAYERARFLAWTWFLVAATVMTASMAFQVIAVVRQRPPRETFTVLNGGLSAASCIGMAWVLSGRRLEFFGDVEFPVLGACMGYAFAAAILLVIAMVRMSRADRQHAAQPSDGSGAVTPGEGEGRETE